MNLTEILFRQSQSGSGSTPTTGNVNSSQENTVTHSVTPKKKISREEWNRWTNEVSVSKTFVLK